MLNPRLPDQQQRAELPQLAKQHLQPVACAYVSTCCKRSRASHCSQQVRRFWCVVERHHASTCCCWAHKEGTCHFQAGCMVRGSSPPNACCAQRSTAAASSETVAMAGTM